MYGHTDTKKSTNDVAERKDEKKNLRDKSHLKLCSQI
jgi:hypothetical protein